MLWKKKISIYYISILYVADGYKVQLDYNNKTIDNFLT